MADDIFDNRFHWCALAAGFLAASEGRLHEQEYVRELAYRWYEDGAFADRLTGSPDGSTVTSPKSGCEP